MLYPPVTSFIPVTIALVKYIESHGFSTLYPYWYLGSTPVKYLIGPVVPVVLVGLHKVLPNFSLFDLSLWLVVACQLLSALGWGVLAGNLSGGKKVGLVAGILTLVLPWHWISGLGLSEVSAVMAMAMTPWVLFAYVHSLATIKKRSTNLESSVEEIFPSCSGLRQHRMLEEGSKVTESWLRHVFDLGQAYALAMMGFGILLLTNSTASIPAIVGLGILGIVLEKRWEDGLMRAGLVVLIGWVISIFWYGPGYWLTIFGAPSIGGKPAIVSLVSFANFLRTLVPVVLAFAIVLWGIRPKGVYQKFAYIWLGIFASMTLFRFMADPKFWLDWTSWMGEVEIGVAFLIAISSVHHFKKRSTKLNLGSISQESVSLRPPLANNSGIKSNVNSSARFVMFLKWLPSLLLLYCIYMIGGWAFAFVHRDFWLPRRNIENTVEYQVAEKLDEFVKPGETVFLSGTTAFWLNAFADVRQVRGGRDEVSKNGQWRDAVWEIRQGESADYAEKALIKLNVTYLVVHTNSSREFYHDFKYPGKFEGSLGFEKVWEQDGDVIYKIK